ncbi:MAG TPA: efflux RND transporter periplasmic adaptor subunit, partial [Phycisphaerae bacterium]|nr:efflux RND transporter periplasmic adaptor subunit [Phycisphaerae bacterium]
INASTEMWIRHLSPPTTGSLVRKDDLLCGFYTTNYLAAAQSYLYILDAVDRMRAAGQDSSAQAASNDVQLRQATELLQNLGVSDFQVREIAKTRQAGSLVQVRSPTDGYVLSRNVSLGQWIGPGTELYQIADLGHVWIFADLFDKEAGTVAPGMAVRVMQRNKGLALTATVSNVPPTFDETSRTTRVRLEAENPGLSLWPGMFVEVEFPLRMPPAIAVPVDAVIDSGLRKTVYVVRDGNYFEPRIVETGWRLGNQVEIVKGLAPGEQIVVSGNFLLDSESRMRMTGSEAGAAAEPHIHAMTSELDPVCGMRVKPAEAAGKSEYKGKTYYFCSSFCKREFDKDPETALKKGMNR